MSHWSVAASLVALLAATGVVWTTAFSAQQKAAEEPSTAVASPSSGASSSQVTPLGDSSSFAVTIRKPAGPPRANTGLHDLSGNPVTVTCSTCHSTREPNANNRAASDLDEFHGSLKFSHGTLSCLSCHNPGDYDSLKLADGTRVEFTEVMTLCAQCHGPQMEAYKHGAHGGMTGHWDLTRGPRQKNNCVDCHHPHSPQLPRMLPTFKPHDRFLQSPRPEH